MEIGMGSEGLASKLTVVICSCEGFSDLWDANISLLNSNWRDRGCEAILVTDAPTDKGYECVKVFPAGAGLELSDRIRAVMPHIHTEYVLVTLDDYFLTKKIHTDRIREIVRMMECESLDYVLLFRKHRPDARFKQYKKIHTISLTRNYQVCLYPGVWRRDFLLKTLRGTLNAWDYEVSLTGIAKEVGARCVQSRRNEFPILDGVRKGKFLISAFRYLKRHGLYSGSRPVMSFTAEFRLNLISCAKRILPRWIIARIRERKIKQGYIFYTDAFSKKSNTPPQK